MEEQLFYIRTINNYSNAKAKINNNILTGTETQPNLGIYTGNINNLTELQIDNLAQGIDYTGTGTSTLWTDKEKVWIIKNLKNSSIDASLRYRCPTFSY